VVVKVRFRPFVTHTHAVTLPAPTVDPEAIQEGAIAALDRFGLDRPVRLLGVRAELLPPDGEPRTRRSSPSASGDRGDA